MEGKKSYDASTNIFFMKKMQKSFQTWGFSFASCILHELSRHFLSFVIFFSRLIIARTYRRIDKLKGLEIPGTGIVEIG